MINMQEEVKCEYCGKLFYLNSFRLQEARTVSCLYCEKRTKTAMGKRLDKL